MVLEEWNCGLSKTISVNEFSIRLGSWNGLSGAAVQCSRRIKVLGVFSQKTSRLRERDSRQSCKNEPTVPTSRCYFFWPVLIFGKSTRKTVLLCLFWTIFGLFWTYYLMLIFLGEKLVGANFLAFCNYDCNALSQNRNTHWKGR